MSKSENQFSHTRAALSTAGRQKPNSYQLRRFLMLPVFLSALASSAYGLSVEIPVTPARLDQGAYVFSVSANTATNGAAFQVIITAKKGDIASDCSVGVCVVSHWGDGSGTQIVPAQPPIPVTLKTNGRIWRADFTVSEAELKQAGLCCVFTEQSHWMVKGKSVPAPSATFYELSLQDFARSAAEPSVRLEPQAAPQGPFGHVLGGDSRYQFVWGFRKPDVLVHDLLHDNWKRITEVSLKNAKLGRSPATVSISWDFSEIYRGKAYAPLPLRTGSDGVSGNVVFPDKVECDTGRSVYLLWFTTKDTPPATNDPFSTRLEIRKQDLDIPAQR